MGFSGNFDNPLLIARFESTGEVIWLRVGELEFMFPPAGLLGEANQMEEKCGKLCASCVGHFLRLTMIN